MKKNIIAVIVCLIATISMFSVAFAKEYKYPDLTWTELNKAGKWVERVHFAVREITQATNIGIMEGYPDGYFRPNDSITRAEFIKMLVCLATNRTFDFSSVKTEYDDWYGSYVTIAEMQEIIDKNEYTVEELNQPITRLETILMLAKTQIRMKGIHQIQTGKLSYTDIDGLTQDEKDLILHAAYYDLLEGMKDGSATLLEPNKNLTRGEAAAALMRIY